jgi:hypothetical protein
MTDVAAGGPAGHAFLRETVGAWGSAGPWNHPSPASGRPFTRIQARSRVSRSAPAVC